MIPAAPLLLGLAGLLPFLWGAATSLSPELAAWSTETLGPRLTGPYAQLQYGTVILAFMSGVIWGFATRAKGGRAAVWYVASVLPALWVFFMVGGGVERSALALIAGFLGLLFIDWGAWRQALAPEWWLRLRLLLTAVVIPCLAVALV